MAEAVIPPFSLPLEVLTMICDHLDAPRDLKASRLINRAFSQVITPRLFAQKSVSLAPEEAVAACESLEGLAASPLSPLLQNVSLQWVVEDEPAGQPTPEEATDGFSAAVARIKALPNVGESLKRGLESLSNLERLTFAMLETAPGDDRFIMHAYRTIMDLAPISLPQLRRLTLSLIAGNGDAYEADQLCQDRDAQVRKFIANAPQLETLYLKFGPLIEFPDACIAKSNHRLTELTLNPVRLDGPTFRDLAHANKATLRQLYIEHSYVVRDSWEDVFISLQECASLRAVCFKRLDYESDKSQFRDLSEDEIAERYPGNHFITRPINGDLYSLRDLLLGIWSDELTAFMESHYDDHLAPGEAEEFTSAYCSLAEYRTRQQSADGTG